MLCKNSAVSRKRNKKLSFSSFRGQQFWQQLIIMILNLLTYLSFYWLYIEAVIRGVLLKKVFLEISQNSQENSLRPATLFKKRLGHRCFLMNFAKFLKTPFLQNIPGRLLLCIGKLRDFLQISILTP